MRREATIALLTVILATLAYSGLADDGNPLAECPNVVADFTPLTVAEAASIQAACDTSRTGSATSDPLEQCPTCICAVHKAITASLQRKEDVVPTGTNPHFQGLTRGQCRQEVAAVLQAYLDTMSDTAWNQLASCLNLSASKVVAMLATCDPTAANATHRKRSLLQVPTGLNNTVAGAQNAAETVSGRFNNLTTDLNQLGQNSSLDAMSRSGSANPGEYVNAFVNDTRGALGAFGKVFTGAGEQSVSNSAWTLMAAAASAAAMLALPLM